MKIFYTNKDNRLKKEIIIFGSGSHAKVVASEILKLNKYKLLGFIDEKTPINNIIYEEKSKKYRVLGKIKYLNKITNKNTFGIIGIGTNFIRERIVSDVKSINKNFKWINIISKDSIISSDVKIGVGTIIVSGSIINTGTTIGRHCIINTGSIIEHDNWFSDFSSSSPRVTTGGNVKVGTFSCLGIGCTISHNISIGENTFIGGRSFVSKDCQNNYLYYGIPAKKIKKRRKTEKYL